MVIIEGLAGMGKSTILSNYYKEIKENNPKVWVIRINLVDLSENISKLDFTQQSAIDFFVDLPAVVGESSFARSLLRHRLKTGHRIVLMLDGFDEINTKCQDKVVELMRSILKKPIQLYVTTRQR